MAQSLRDHVSLNTTNIYAEIDLQMKAKALAHCEVTEPKRSLDITFLRRDNPGGPIESCGDLDNRIKVLFDGLRIPHECSEVVGQPEQDENPFFCLLEDDKLITDITVRTDKLLTPLEGEERVHDVML